ncbi:SBP (S-ribonuclease binding protein) family protein [Striga asiatica]|uniref:SBP (S-ribonuclease binding protein) family protein n=1 Tax=Striga asiatica TaxID=4170 RepID=A0A5A7RHZ5_STRAF|nr:SBP (S-ribonuclease binding protein) family protein [Striga asiatica]
MLGGGKNGNSVIPGFVEENRSQYDNNTMAQLQLFGHVPVQYGPGVSTVNYMGSRKTPNNDNKIREGESSSMQHKLQISLNNNSEVGLKGNFVNPNNYVSTGLKLSCEDEERNSSISSACENMKGNANIPVMLSLGSTVKMEIDRQTEEFDRYFKLQEQSILKGVRDINQRHTASLLTALEKGVYLKLHEKDLQIESLNRKNKELGEKIKQASMEAQSWHHKARYNESVVNTLKSNIQQLMEQNTTRAREGSGDSSEVDDAGSCSDQMMRSYKGHICKVCAKKGVSVLVLPCRHLCLCVDCEGFVDVCPVCKAMKTASVCVYM